MRMKIANNLRYILQLIVSTPYYFVGIGLNFASSILAIIGIPMLLPAIEYLNNGGVILLDSKYAEITLPIFNYIGVDYSYFTILALSSLLIITSQLFLFGIEVFNIKIQIKIINSYMYKLINNYFKSNWSWIASDSSGEFHSSISREVNSASEAHLDSQRLVSSVLQVLTYTGVAFFISIKITIIAIVFFLTILAVNVLLSNNVSSYSSNYNNSFIDLSSLISGISSNKKFFKCSDSSNFIDLTLNKMRLVNQISLKLSVLIVLLSSFSIVSAMVFIVFIFMFYEQLGVASAEIMVLFLVFAKLAPQFSLLSGNYIRISERIPIHKTVNKRILLMQNNQESSGKNHFNFKDDIEFHRVLFKYDKNIIIDDISMSIKALKTTAIVGGSGAGKSTLLDLILGLITPNNGDIYYGGISQEDLDIELFRRDVAYISQDSTLVDGSLLFNLTISNPNASMDCILEACKKAHLLDFIESLPNKFETNVGEDGIKISGGQRQRIALARALVGNPSVLILDEATSQLDSETEQFIKDAMNDFQGKLTVIIVAHRLSTIKHADIVHVLENGRIVESGTYSNLLKAQGRLYELDKLQSD